ncbi:MAG: hypothetical protein BAJATHORv1_10147 [Candidatus Thorarchaeota archaeon]|nr:MAG: hypothetical protein BAJATHORv1_10147 [Candidatus Thorarchaeota archaeon]
MSEDCEYLSASSTGLSCKLRNQVISHAEAKAKCKRPDLSVICVDAYTSLSRGQEAITQKSTDAFPWLVDSATHFENLKETDNAIMAISKAIRYATKMGLPDKAYEFFVYARMMLENALEEGDPTVLQPGPKITLIEAGNGLIEAVKQQLTSAAVSEVQAELKASLLEGVSLKKAEVDDTKDLVIYHGRALYAKKLKEYKEGAENYIKSGIVQNAVTFACMAALAELMLGRPKEGIAYLTKTANQSEQKEKWHKSKMFKWTKLIFKAFVTREEEPMNDAQKLFFQLAWAFKDDKQFAQRVMDSVQRRVSQ